MLKKKNLPSLLAILVIASVVMAACTPTPANPTELVEEHNNNPEDEGVEEEPVEPEEPVSLGIDPSGQTVIFWHFWGSDPAAEGMAGIVADFNATNEWGITVDAVDHGRRGELETAINNAIASGDLPNISPGFSNSIAAWYNVGVIATLNDYIADGEFGLNPEAYDAIFDANLAAGARADGTQIAMPIHQSENVLFYNHSWAHELGFESPPENTAEFKEQACTAAKANAADDDPDNDGTGGFVYRTGAANIASWLFAFGGSFLNDAGDAYTMNTPEMLAVAEFLGDLSAKGCSVVALRFPEPELAARKALFTASSTVAIPIQIREFENAGNNDEWGLIAFPGPGGTLAVNASGQMMAVFDQTPEANLAAWLWLRHFTSPEVQAEWITYSAYFPSQSTTADFLGDYIKNNPRYAQGVDLTQYGQAEPNLASWGSVRGAVEDAFSAIAFAEGVEEMQAILVQLEETAAELLAESQ